MSGVFAVAGSRLFAGMAPGWASASTSASAFVIERG